MQLDIYGAVYARRGVIRARANIIRGAATTLSHAYVLVFDSLARAASPIANPIDNRCIGALSTLRRLRANAYTEGYN
jgi:hypothetical protein